MIFRAVFFWNLLILVIMGAQVPSAVAQLGSEPSYEVFTEVPAINSNFFQAREKALKMSLKLALEQYLREFLGDEEFERNQGKMQRMLRTSKKYVKSYRFIEVYDDLIALVSQVKLEVVLFQDTINRYLSETGVTTRLKEERQIVILINESSLSSDNRLRFWETRPISETSLARNFIEEGIPVVRRDSIRHAIPEETVMGAMRGDLSAAASIGRKAGADIVIVGNATSAVVANSRVQDLQPVRVAISIKAISSQNSTLIAAKSDFATIKGNEVLASELKAFHSAGKKLARFLIPAIQNHWDAGDDKKEVKQFARTPKADSSPLPWGDL